MPKKQDDWTTEERLISQQFKKLYREDCTEAPAADLTFMTTADRSIRHSAPYKLYARIAAIIMLMISSSLVTAICITGGYADAFKGSVEKKLFKMNSSIIVSEEEISDEETEVWEITDESLLSKLPEAFSELKTPSYIPEDYCFQKAVIEQYVGENYVATYSYVNDLKTDTLCIVQMPVLENADVSTSSNGEIIELEDRIICMQDDPFSDIKGCSVVFDDVLIQVSSKALNEEEMKKIGAELL